MRNSQDFLPKQQDELQSFGNLWLRVLAPGDLGPAVFNLTDAHVADLTALVSEHSTLLLQARSLRATLKGITRALSGRKGATARLSACLRRDANTARASDAAAPQLTRIGLKRKPARGSRRNAPIEPPALFVRGVISSTLHFGFGEVGSASPRARARNTIGVQIAVVDAANPVTDGEADHAPLKSVSRSPASLSTKGWPDHVRLYGRWFTPRGDVSSWSLFLPVTVR